ncbi:hypothetical protein like AT3G14250 [Hibiscus trionum]|uniref:RBR-type E3 ubiquitin transferase n=1 Tax=Hibiscus trionum TaxID=183268 RepID=A0A9W7HRP2_HIBTR|nr:hypothetical protein like AT3G14250 [Hibiscus trionum]
MVKIEDCDDGDIIHLVDDFYFSALFDDDEVFPISDEKYASELHLQEALMSSAISSATRSGLIHHLQTYHHVNSTTTRKGKEKQIGESSNSQTNNATLCIICTDFKPVEEMFRSNTCSHLFCKDCIGKYVAAKIQENIAMVKCPDINCQAALEPQFCRSIVPGDVFDRWESALCESMILGLQKFYCPFKDCSALLLDDGGSDVVKSECPSCHRLFCAQCKVAWHSGISCGEFRKLGKDERSMEDIMAHPKHNVNPPLMVMELAKNKKWRRCPSCKIYVEKTEGCSHISCRCKFQFCYGCGSQWNQTHNCS